MKEQLGLGKLGEDIAVRYLKKKGFKIIERNHRKKWGELDIIALAPDKTLVFVEAKTVSGPEPKIAGEDQMTASKLKKFHRAAEIYANTGSKRQRTNSWRCDLVTVTTEGHRARIRHYKNV